MILKNSTCSGCRWKKPPWYWLADFLWRITAFIIGLPCNDLIFQQRQSRSQLLSSHLMAFFCFIAYTHLVCLLSSAPLLLFCLSVLNRCAGESVLLTSPTVSLPSHFQISASERHPSHRFTMNAASSLHQHCFLKQHKYVSHSRTSAPPSQSC